MESANKFSKRNRQVADLIQRELSLALRQEIKDPRLTDVTITEVRLSPDFRQAKIYFTVVDDKKLPSVLTALEHASGHFRHIIASRSELRYTPSLIFYYDEMIIHGEKMDRLLKDVDLDENQ